MKVWRIAVLGVAAVLLVGCKSLGLGGKRIDYGAGATQVPALEIPPDLTAPAGDERYRVPQGGEGVATYSGYRRDDAAEPGERPAVLPEVKGVRLERSGAQRWLAVNDRPENVWAVVRTFLQENGLAIKSEDQAAGVMETDWAESRDSAGGAAGERNQYRVRLERGKGGDTEVYITHRGMEEVLAADKGTSKWQVRASDPELEAVMLQRLMARFGGEAQAATPVSGLSGAVGMRQASDGSGVMVVNDTFDRSWRKVGLAIERAGLAVEDKDRAKGVYFLSPPRAESGWLDKLQFWKDSKGASTRYRVNVKDGGAICEVSVTSLDGASDGASRQMLEAILRNIEQGNAGAASLSAISTTGPAGTASLQEVFDGSRVIIVNDSFERSWRRVGVAIERAGLPVESSDHAAGIYFLRTAKVEGSWLSKLEFWRSDESNVHHRVNVRDGGKACEVSVTDQDGSSDDATRQMIEEIYKNIGQ